MPRILLLVLAIALSCNAQKGDFFTSQMANGRAWMAMSSNIKLFYVSGLHDGIIAEAAVYFNKPDDVAKKWAKGFETGDYVKEIEEVYKHRENLLLPIPAVMEYCTIKLRGEKTEAELEQTLIFYRQMFR